MFWHGRSLSARNTSLLALARVGNSVQLWGESDVKHHVYRTSRFDSALMNAMARLGRSVRRTVRQASAKSHKRRNSPLRRPLTGQASPRKPKSSRPLAISTAVTELASVLAEDSASIVEHPDGFHWIAPDGRQQFGPFESFELARADRDRFNEQAPTPGETLQEAEREIGISGWIDPETGEPAEGQSPPYLDEG